jgi:hypothetical protein
MIKNYDERGRSRFKHSLILLFLRVVFGEVLQTTQLFMRDITVIDPTWLEELAPHYFQKVTER